MRTAGIPLVFLEACQRAQVESDPSASVAAALLAAGVTSVVARRHTVLVETARRFVQTLYRPLVSGGTVGTALLAGQPALKADPARGQLRGAGELRLQEGKRTTRAAASSFSHRGWPGGVIAFGFAGRSWRRVTDRGSRRGRP